MSERSSDGRPVVSEMGHTVVYMEIGIPSLYMVYRGGGGGQRHDVLYEKRHESPPFFKTATKRTLTQREHVDKRNEYFIAAFQWHVNYS